MSFIFLTKKQTPDPPSGSTLWSWGENNYGQLGLGDIIDRSLPVQIGLLTDWSSVSNGDNFSFGLKEI